MSDDSHCPLCEGQGWVSEDRLAAYELAIYQRGFVAGIEATVQAVNQAGEYRPIVKPCMAGSGATK